MHHVVEIVDYNLFKSIRFMENFKSNFNKAIKELNKNREKETPNLRVRKLPKIQVFFSIEHKLITGIDDEGNTIDSFGKVAFKRDYHHIHLMTIIDVTHNVYGHAEIHRAITKALSGILGLESLDYDEQGNSFKNGKAFPYGFLKARNEKSIIKKKGEYKSIYWHDLKTEFEDAVIRASYLSKTCQKKMVKCTQTFGKTRKSKLQSVITL